VEGGIAYRFQDRVEAMLARLNCFTQTCQHSLIFEVRAG
jgi:hypothetical protein